MIAGEYPNGFGRVLFPRQVDGPRGEVVRAGQIEERRQQILGRHFAGRHDLRDRESIQLGAADCLCRGIDVRHGDVGGPQIDANEIARHSITVNQFPESTFAELRPEIAVVGHSPTYRVACFL